MEDNVGSDLGCYWSKIDLLQAVWFLLAGFVVVVVQRLGQSQIFEVAVAVVDMKKDNRRCCCLLGFLREN